MKLSASRALLLTVKSLRRCADGKGGASYSMKYPDGFRPCALLFGFALVCGAALPSPASAVETAPATDSASGYTEDFNAGWRFHLGEASGAEQPGFDDSGWRALDLPHDWSIELQHDKDTPDGNNVGYLRGGVGWYRKAFVLPAADQDRCVDVIFDGVQQDCEVWINGHSLGLQPHGYVGFVHSLTRHLKPPGERNVIAVRAVNPDRNTRWYAGSGIYRGVRLRVRTAVDVATWGLRLSTTWITKDKAQVQFAAEFCNERATSERVELVLRLHKPQGGSEDFGLGEVRLAPKATEQVGQLFTVSAPQLWSPDSPALYTAELRLMQQGKRIGGLSATFGLRQVAVSAREGFVLNGQSIKLKGGCLHHDNGLIGAAAFPAAEWRRVETMKRNGFNAIRTSHNPPSAAFLDACDQLGMLVIDEFVDMWELPKKPNGYNRYFARHWEKDLTAMLQRDFNHPSVVIWSIGNEIQERTKPAGLEIARKMIAAVRSIDPQRPITQAICGFWDNPDIKDWDATAPAFALLDIGGYNYQWTEYEKDHAKFPERVMMGTESIAKEAYEYWRLVERHSYVIGDFVWTGMDHIGESGIGHTDYVKPGDPEPPFMSPWPTWINWSGDIDLIGDKKPQSFYRDVVWGRAPVEMAVHAPVPEGVEEQVGFWGWPDELATWNWPGLEGRALTVRVFSRAARVRLELNGKPVGERPISLEKGIVASFDVPFAPGELKATALAADGSVVGTRVIATTGAPAVLATAPELAKVKASRAQLIYVPIDVRDSAGRRVNRAELKVSADITGPAEILAFGSANPTAMGNLRDREAETFRGRALLILRSTGEAGRVQLKLSAPGLPASVTEFDLRS